MSTMITSFDDLLRRAAGLSPKRILVVNPANTETFQAIANAQKKLPTTFLLVGDPDLIGRHLADEGGDPAKAEIIAAPRVNEALEKGIALAREEKADVLMKGSVDTSTMMKAVLLESSGLKTGRLLSDIFILEFPERKDNKLIMITDGGMTLSLELKNKVDLIKNAVFVAHALGNPEPKVAVLSATEFVLPNLQSTLDAAALSKMNDRGQIKGCIVDGPLALDNAISPEAAEEKGIISKVAGRADILLAANIESANSLAKSTTYFAGLRLAHVIVGSRIPILIPSRADKSDAKLLSIAAGMLMSGQAWKDD
ncbi:MAG: bifunctional enoyl-CoA hydratase/phosphate acetyltransferase [Proteobacteria bacterium]|nr:bifunctional enoyl-CoA hydratase/phosphate acetyltransferase [Pseudomonadota bacterium]